MTWKPKLPENNKSCKNSPALIAAKEMKLENKYFVDRAPAEVVQKERDSLSELWIQHEAAIKSLAELSKAK